MKKSFARNNTAEDTAPEPPAETAVAVRAETQVGPLADADDMAGQFSSKDIRLPRLNLVHKTSNSELIEKFGIGSFIYNKEVKLSDGKTPLSITALLLARDLVQKLPYGDPTPPLSFKTEEEVIQAGGSLNWKDKDSGNFYQPRAHIQVIVEKPADADEALFPYEFQGKSYGMAMFTVSSSAYTSVGKELATYRQQNKIMKKGLRYGRLELTSVTRPHPRNPWLVPVVKYVGENPEELVKFFEGLL